MLSVAGHRKGPVRCGGPTKPRRFLRVRPTSVQLGQRPPGRSSPSPPPPSRRGRRRCVRGLSAPPRLRDLRTRGDGCRRRRPAPRPVRDPLHLSHVPGPSMSTAVPPRRRELSRPYDQTVGGAAAGPLVAAFTDMSFHRLPHEDDASASVSGSSAEADEHRGHQRPDAGTAGRGRAAPAPAQHGFGDSAGSRSCGRRRQAHSVHGHR